MEGSGGLYDALLVWLSTFDSEARRADVSDGVTMARALHKIDSGRVFTSEWLTKIKADVPSENKRLKGINLKKVLNGIHDYNSDVLGIKMNSGFFMPDINSAAQGNKQHLSKFLFSYDLCNQVWIDLFLLCV